MHIYYKSQKLGNRLTKKVSKYRTGLCVQTFWGKDIGLKRNKEWKGYFQQVNKLTKFFNLNS